MLCVFVFACTALMATTAPVQQNVQADPPLVRTKRSEEAIMFGNHQNFARIKKGDLHPRPLNYEEPKDKDEILKTQKAPLIDEKPMEEGTAHGAEDPTEDEEQQIERLLTPDAELDSLTAREDEAEKNRIVEKFIEEQEHPETAHSTIPSEGLPIAHPDKMLEDKGSKLEEETASGDSDPFGEDKNDYLDSYYDARNDDSNNLLFPPALFKSYREKRSAAAAKARESRSLPVAVKAEDMMSAGPSENIKKLTGRVKRDLPLSPEEVEELLKRDYYDYAGPREYGDEDYYSSYYPDEPAVERRASPGEESWDQENNEGIPDDMPVLDIDPRSYDQPMYLPDDVSDENEIDPEEQRRLELLEYLYSQDGQTPYDGEPEYPGDFEEFWQDLGPAKELPYEPSYEEDMVPSKRQYLSFVPGVKREWNEKRNPAEFYPYQYGPDGRWGAMVPDPNREKRNEMAEYERLYELAQALNGPDMSEGSYLEKRFDYEEPVYFSDYDRRRK